MKPMKVSIVFIAMLVTGIVFYSCQKDNMQVPRAEQAIKVLKDGQADCNVACLADGPFYQVTESFTRQWSPLSKFPGYYRNNKLFTAKAWNDLDNFYIEINSSGYMYDQQRIDGQWTLLGPDDVSFPFNDVQITLNGISYNISMDDPATTDIIETAINYTFEYPLETGWMKCDEMVYSVKLLGDGQPVWLGTVSAQENVTYTLYGDCVISGELTSAGTICYDYLAPYYRYTVYFFESPSDLAYVNISGSLIDRDVWQMISIVVDGGYGSNYYSITDHLVEGTNDWFVSVSGPVPANMPVAITLLWYSIYPDQEYITSLWTASDAQGNLIDSVEPLVCTEWPE